MWTNFTNMLTLREARDGSYGHRMFEVEANPPLQGSMRADSSGLCPIGFWISLWTQYPDNVFSNLQILGCPQGTRQWHRSDADEEKIRISNSRSVLMLSVKENNHSCVTALRSIQLGRSSISNLKKTEHLWWRHRYTAECSSGIIFRSFRKPITE